MSTPFSLRARSAPLLLALPLALLVACGPPEGGTDAGSGTDAGPSGPPEVVFDLAGEFFDAPYPSDLRTDADGHPDLSAFPARRGIVQEGADLVTLERSGFSALTGVYFRFTAPLAVTPDPDPAAREAESSPIWLVDVDDASPERGRRLPAYATFYAQPSRFWPGSTLVVRPVPGLHLHPGRRYAAVIRESLDPSIVRSPAFEALKTDTSSREGMHYAALFAALEEMGLPRAEIVSATMFTVNDPATEMDLARDWIMAQPLPTVGNWRLRRISGSEIRAAAEFDTYELLDGDPPYSELGSARIHFDPDGTPAVVNRVTVQVGISYPAGEIPVGGHPVVLYGHGTGGDAETHFGAEGAALAEQGIATLGFEAALHGGRVPAPIAVENLIGENPIAAREVVRQTVLDMVLIYRMIAAGAFTLPADLNRGTEVPLAASPVMYMGHSQGSQEAGVLMGLEPSLQASFLSEGGMSAIITIEERELTAGSPIKCLIASLVQEDCSLMTEDHPLITLIIQPLLEPADPAVFAHRFLRERDASWAPLSIAMTEGTADPFTPPRGIEALAVATGLPLVAPVVQATEPFMLTGTMTATPPVVDNLTSSSSAMVTGGLMQFEGQGHFAIYELEDAKRRYVEFFHTFVLDGTPTIVGP